MKRIVVIALMLCPNPALMAESLPDTYIGTFTLTRDANNEFQTSDQRLKEFAAYLDNSQLLAEIKEARFDLHKSLIEYSPYCQGHWGEAWYDSSGQIVDKNGDDGLLEKYKESSLPIPDDEFSKHLHATKLKILTMQEKEVFFEPFVLYENETAGKDVVDILDLYFTGAEGKGIMWWSYGPSYYRLPKAGAPLNLDNVDAGNIYWNVRLTNYSQSQLYYFLTSGTSPRYPRNQEELRWNWEYKNKKEASFFVGQSSHIVFHGKKIAWEFIKVYPHLTNPEIVLEDSEENAEWTLNVNLPQYFSGTLIPAFVVVNFISEKNATITMVRGAIKKTYNVRVEERIHNRFNMTPAEKVLRSK